MICDQCKMKEKCILRALVRNLDECLVFNKCSSKGDIIEREVDPNGVEVMSADELPEDSCFKA